MKKNFLIILSIILFFSSCNDFLEEYSQDKIIPKTVTDYSNLLYGEAYLKNDLMNYLHLMTDDVTTYFSTAGGPPPMPGEAPNYSTALSGIFGYLTWQRDAEAKKDLSYNDDKSWAEFYKSIVICNNVINNIDNINGDTKKKNYLLGEAYFIRSLAYFNLVNLYGEPYKKESANSALGIPINDEHEVSDRSYTRSSVQEVYNKILTDLKLSADLIKKSNNTSTIFRANLASVYQLLSRAYLYTKDYENTIIYANLSLEYNANLYNLTSVI